MVNDLETYLMREPGERCYMRYAVEVNKEGEIVKLTLLPNIGTRRAYERIESNSRELYTYTVRNNPEYIPPGCVPVRELLEFIKNEPSEENKLRGQARYEAREEEIRKQQELNPQPECLYSEKTLVDKLRVSSPIVRDAFCQGMTAEKLFAEYKLQPDSGVIVCREESFDD